MSKILKVVGASWLQTKISSYILCLLGILAILALFVGQMERIQEDGTYAATVFYSQKTGYSIEYWGQSNELAEIPRGVARAYFRKDIDTIGWSLLEVETDGSYPDEIQAYAAGVVEGALTWYLIHTHLENTIRATCEGREKQCDKIRDSLDKSVKIWKSYADDRTEDPFWHHVSLYYTQINGIYTGWFFGVERSMTEYDTDVSDLYWLNSIAEIVEIQKKLNITLDDETVSALPGLSSAFLRIVNVTEPDGTESKKIFVAQNAAGSYSSMTRILKRYKFNYHIASNDSSLVPSTTIDFTGYPGSITSQDEFYILGGDEHKMVVTGTALKNYNNKLWKDVNITEQVPAGPRITSANRLANNVSTWGHILASSNSGTACKQWLVVDLARFGKLNVSHEDSLKSEKKDAITETTIDNDIRHTFVHRSRSGHAKGLVWLLEQVPGRTHSADLSDTIIERGYWATYGLPFFTDIAEITHVTKMQEMYGEIFSESKSPRANLFAKGYKNATTIESILKLMRQNNMTQISNKVDTNCQELHCLYKEEGYWSVLGVRGDVVNKFKKPYGVLDTKIVAVTLRKSEVDFLAVSSPPFTDIPAHPNITTIAFNKGNVATLYTDQFDDEPTINGLEIRDLVKQQQKEAAQETYDSLHKYAVKPFQWSESEFQNKHEGLPDKWDFGPFQPKWSW